MIKLFIYLGNVLNRLLDKSNVCKLIKLPIFLGKILNRLSDKSNVCKLIKLFKLLISLGKILIDSQIDLILVN